MNLLEPDRLWVRLIPADQSRLRRLLALVAPLDKFWVTYRLPFQRQVTITYPPSLMYWIAADSPMRMHEMVHARQFATWWGPWVIPLLVSLFPLPVLFSGRWWVERRAYLKDIRTGRMTVRQAADALWDGYWCPWPRRLMRQWFHKQLEKDDG